MAGISFPGIQPSSRTYDPGSYPQSEFRALNGATTRVRFGHRRVDSKLSLEFQNITDNQAAQILKHYEDVNAGDHWAQFSHVSGADNGPDGWNLHLYLVENRSGLRFRYDGPPEVESVMPGISTVRCRFIGQLDGPA